MWAQQISDAKPLPASAPAVSSPLPIWEMLCCNVREARLGFLNVRFSSFRKQICCRGVFAGFSWIPWHRVSSGSGTALVHAGFFPKKYHSGASLSIKVQWVSAGTDSCNVVSSSRGKKKKGKKLKGKKKGSQNEKESFVLQSVSWIFYSIKAEIGKSSGFGPISPSLQLCRAGMDCSVSHGDGAGLVFTLLHSFVPSPLFFCFVKLLSVE